MGLNQDEVRGAILLALIAFVIYPVLPNRFIDPWMIVNPREAWLVIVLPVGQRNRTEVLWPSAVIAFSALGALASSASSTAAVALMVSHKSIAPRQAAIATPAASIASMLINLPIVYGQLQNKPLIRTQIALSGGVALVGGAVIAIVSVF